MTKAEIKLRIETINNQQPNEIGDKLKKALEVKLKMMEGKQVNK